MPRICTSASDPIDFCKACFPPPIVAALQYSNLGNGPDGRGNCFSHDADHPDYEDEVDYECVRCGKRLTSEDN